jgi:photosystem II stability/assembly factor-like uncharacterized protein
LQLLAIILTAKNKPFIMKFLKQLVVILSVAFIFTACRSTPNHIHEPVNSTESGSSAASGDEAASDTASPVQPNGIDTSGEQTGRMTNTTATQGLPADSNK